MTDITLVQAGAEDAPVACTLDPREYSDRTAGLSDLAARGRTDRAPIDGGQRLSFTDVLDVTGPDQAQPIIAELFA